jgi:hypothetical protein
MPDKAFKAGNRTGFPKTTGTSLYIRPTMISTDEYIGVKAASRYLFYIILSPVGPYYSEGFQPVKIYIEDTYIRAAKGGLGEAKTMANYAASLLAGEEAAKKGYTQVLGLDAAEKRYVQEVGSMNMFFKINARVVTSAAGRGDSPRHHPRFRIEAVRRFGRSRSAAAHHGGRNFLPPHADGSWKKPSAQAQPRLFLRWVSSTMKEKSYVIQRRENRRISMKLYESLTDIQYGQRCDSHGWSVKYSNCFRRRAASFLSAAFFRLNVNGWGKPHRKQARECLLRIRDRHSVRIKGHQNAASEVIKAAVSISDALHNFDGVVDAFGKAVGIRAVKSIKNIRLPVFEHCQAGIKFRDVGSKSIHTKLAQTKFGFNRISRSHETVEGFFEQIGLAQIPGEQEHMLHGLLIVVGKILHMGKEQSAASLKVFALFGEQGFLDPFSHVFKSPCRVTNNVKSVYNDCGVSKKCLGDFQVFFIHIHHHIYDAIPVGEGLEVVQNVGGCPVGQDIDNRFVPGRSQNALKFAAAGIAPKFVDR